MVGPDRVVNAVGLTSVIVHSSRIIGPAAATMDLSLTLWPEGERRVLAHCGGHGPPIDPLGLDRQT